MTDPSTTLRQSSGQGSGHNRRFIIALFPDTRPEAEAVLIGLLRQAPPWRKLQMVGQLNQTVRTLALSGLRQRHPQATPQELRRRLADLLLGVELAAQVYGPLGEQE
jgi:hypothetical protein